MAAASPGVSATAAGSLDSVNAPEEAYRQALRGCSGALLRGVFANLGQSDLKSNQPAVLSQELNEFLSQPGVVESAIARLSSPSRLALGLYALWEVSAIPAAGLLHALGCLGVEHPRLAILEAMELGLIASRSVEVSGLTTDLAATFDSGPEPILLIHPSALAKASVAAPSRPPSIHDPGPVVEKIRQSDGLEFVLRLAAVWQRLDEAALRRTQSRSLYKRDRDRLEEDPATAGSLADQIEPLPDMTALWLGLALEVGLALDDPEADRIVAVRASYWAEHAVHLPQMIALAWLRLPRWHERLGAQDESSSVELAVRYVRTAVMLWLSAWEEGEWVGIGALAECLGERNPHWEDLLIGKREAILGPAAKTGRRADEPAAMVRQFSGRDPEPSEKLVDRIPLLRAILFGPAYQLNLVEAADDSKRPDLALVRLTPLGRYALKVGPPPPPRPFYDQFLYVQPNFETIAYRQGLNPASIGQLSRFLRWSQIGSALELKLTAQSVYQGLQGGMTPEQMLERLSRHSPRTLAPSVADAIRNWSARREKITMHASATLMEFATEQDLELALSQWPTQGELPRRIAPRLLLVEDAGQIPFQKFRLAGSRDYRLPLDACVEVEPDGVHLNLDLGRSDLMADAEISRFARPIGADGAKRRYLVTPESIAAALDDGMTVGRLERWFKDRANCELPPALRLLLGARREPPSRFAIQTRLVLQAGQPELLDGLLQHPATSSLIGERLGPSAAALDEANLEKLRDAIAALGWVRPS